MQGDKEDKKMISKDLYGLDIKVKYDANANPILTKEHNDALKAIFALKQRKIKSKTLEDWT